jgi:hypothetical protein
LPKYIDTTIPHHLITDFIKKTIARKRNKIINGCLKLHPGKWMCSKLCSAMYMAMAFPASTHLEKKKTLVTWLGD